MKYQRIVAFHLALALFAIRPALAATAYTYDQLGRVHVVQYDNGREIIYSYDAAGNRTAMAVTTNGAPVANSDTLTTTTNVAKTIDPRVNDTDPDGDALTITAKTNGLHGTVIFTANSVTYTPATGYTGSDSFTYTISDGHSHTDIGTVSVTVLNGPPTAVDDAKSLNQDTSLTFDPRTNDTDPDGDTLTITAKTNGTHGTVTINAGTTLTYTPAAGYSGSNSFTYTISDGHGNSDTATVTVTVSHVNHAPVAVADSFNINHTIHAGDPPYFPTGSTNPVANDTDADGDTLIVVGVTQPTDGSGTVTFSSNSVAYSSSTGTIVPLTATETFTYTVSDGYTTAVGTVTVHIHVMSDQ